MAALQTPAVYIKGELESLSTQLLSLALGFKFSVKTFYRTVRACACVCACVGACLSAMGSLPPPPPPRTSFPVPRDGQRTHFCVSQAPARQGELGKRSHKHA